MRANRNRRQDWEAEKSVMYCNRCGCPVTWRKNKAGKMYLKDVVIERKNGHFEVFESRNPYHCCPGTIDEQIARRREVIDQLTKELAEYTPDSWFDNTDYFKQTIAANEQALLELLARKSS